MKPSSWLHLDPLQIGTRIKNNRMVNQSFLLEYMLEKTFISFQIHFVKRDTEIQITGYILFLLKPFLKARPYQDTLQNSYFEISSWIEKPTLIAKAHVTIVTSRINGKDICDDAFKYNNK